MKNKGLLMMQGKLIEYEKCTTFSVFLVVLLVNIISVEQKKAFHYKTLSSLSLKG